MISFTLVLFRRISGIRQVIIKKTKPGVKNPALIDRVSTLYNVSEH